MRLFLLLPHFTDGEAEAQTINLVSSAVTGADTGNGSLFPTGTKIGAWATLSFGLGHPLEAKGGAGGPECVQLSRGSSHSAAHTPSMTPMVPLSGVGGSG